MWVVLLGRVAAILLLRRISLLRIALLRISLLRMALLGMLGLLRVLRLLGILWGRHALIVAHARGIE